MTSQRVIILTWNPSNDDLSDEEDAITTIDWSCQSYRSTKKGDRFIFVRTGDKDPGLISFGEVLEDPTLGEDCAGKTRHFVNIKFYVPLCPNSKPIITRDELYKKYHKDIKERTFSPQSSGAELKPEIASDLWAFLSDLYKKADIEPNNSANTSENTTLTPSSRPRNEWLFTPGFVNDIKSGLWNACLDSDIMCVGWVGNLEANFKGCSCEEIQKKWGEQFLSETRTAPQIYNFLNVMAPGDIVYAKMGVHKIIGWGVVTSAPFFMGPEPDENGWTNFRFIKWHWSGVIDVECQLPRDTLKKLDGTEKYYKSLKSALNNKGIEFIRVTILDLREAIETDFNLTLRKVKEEFVDATNQMSNTLAIGDGLTENFSDAFVKIRTILECSSLRGDKTTKNFFEEDSALDKVFRKLKWEWYWNAYDLCVFQNSNDLIRLIDGLDLVYDPVKTEKFFSYFEDSNKVPNEDNASDTDAPEVDEPDEDEIFDPSHDDDYKTEAERTAHLRRGQEKYRNRLMKLWGNACAVTGIKSAELLRASHAIPWFECKSNEDRLNPYNGLLLSVSLDALFDRDLICFKDDGKICISESLDLNELKQMGITPDMRLREVHSKNLPYLQAQRKRFEEKEKEYLKSLQLK